ncbi:Spt10p Ecym_5212 [Eremothecium cymbalariae DBVPG|uniref:N-acetyltransferase domain-containing protein n=1 Tax=Eremothecium cymbalariae (strain CBS 270.75 / DBVPG 7215 / KCTC 17166 / NRRL Y-17582) TaxID=931890 RepID=I6ND39_ERECY|nr:hypothetical protein Ecym_5212 [Eremothecium cymbalariae DBVPG\
MIFRNSETMSNAVSHGSDEERQDLEAYLTPLQPHTILLKDGETTATMYPIRANPDLLPLGLLAFLLDEFNMEVEKGDSFPYYEPLNLEDFGKIWFHTHGIVCVMVLGEIPELDYSLELSEEARQHQNDLLQQQGFTTGRNTMQYLKRKERRNLNLNIQWEKQCLGAFNLIPAYPGRSSHVVTGTFLVNAGIRGKGIGRTLVERFLDWAPQLGFTSCCFPLVYGTNVGIRRILESSNFKRIGKLPEAGILKGYDSPIDSFIYGKEFTHVSKQIDALNSARNDSIKAKYERLKFYLETSEYPASCSRNEKARLRVMSKTHSILNGKLMFKGREVVYEPQRQLEIAYETHAVDHQGINRVTSKVAERYHWKGIKQSVGKVISTCSKCQDHAGNTESHFSGTGIIVDTTEPENQTHLIVHSHTNDNLNRVTEVVGSFQNDEQSRFQDERYKDPTLEDESLHRVKSYKTGSQLRRIRFGLQTGKERVVTKRLTSNEGSMNSFTRYAEEQRKQQQQQHQKSQPQSQQQLSGKKRLRYADITSDIIRSEQSHNDSDPGTALLEESTPNMVDHALMHLEDNVIAAVEAVQKEQQEHEMRRKQHADVEEKSSGNDEEDDPSFNPDDSGYY